MPPPSAQGFLDISATSILGLSEIGVGGGGKAGLEGTKTNAQQLWRAQNSPSQTRGSNSDEDVSQKLTLRSSLPKYCCYMLF